MYEGLDREALKGSVEGYIGRSREIFDASFLDLAEEEIEEMQKMKGFSFPTNEGMRKITKSPELDKLENDPILSKVAAAARSTIKGIQPQEAGGLYAGVNAFHHGHIAYLSKSEAVLALDMNKIVPYGFAFIVGLVGGATDAINFKRQVGLMAANPQILRDAFENTELEKTALIAEDTPSVRNMRQKLLEGLLSVMEEFNPLAHGQNKVPPVFCEDQNAYDYFRTLAVQDKIAGAAIKLQGQGMMDVLSKSLTSFPLARPRINTLYLSSCFDPRFLGSKERGKFLKRLEKEGHTDLQVVESFLNSGWITYDLKSEE